MDSPFLFGRTVTEQAFTNRTADINRLSRNLQNGINTVLISPRRWGKSSLVKKVADQIKGRQVKLVQLDLFSIRNETDFYNTLAIETIKATSTKFTEWVQNAKQFFRHVTPKISIGTDPAQDFEISFAWKDLEKNYKEVLNLPQQIAAAKGWKLVICIDEFQNLSSFKEPHLFQKRLRTEWQHHDRVTYCLYGSRQHMMSELFEKQSMPFYRFGDVIYLPKIERADWIRFVQNGFAGTKKSISAELANAVASLVEDHSYYVQQLAYLVWVDTNRAVTEEIVRTAADNLLAQNSLLYTRDTELLTNAQLQFLKAVASGIHAGLTSKEVLKQFDLGTSANAVKIKKALVQKEMIEETAKGSFFLDPVYKLWFQKNILKREPEWK